VIRINLAPADVQRSRPGAGFSMPSINVGLVFLVICVLELGVIGAWWVSARNHEQQLLAENDRTAKEIDTLKATVGQGSNLKAQLADIRKRVEVIGDLVKGQQRPVQLLDAFADTVPRDLWITGFEDKGAVLKVSGTAFSTKAVSDFMANLRQSGKFKDVDIVVSRQDLTKNPSMVTFEVTCRFEV
jgi:type IV pilus assembly protein PilN